MEECHCCFMRIHNLTYVSAANFFCKIITSFLYTDCILDHILHGSVPINVLKHPVLAAEE